ncbi:MAG TPA: tocopherol cyclase family protein [Solirubrobacteraceae bacterium]|nr:tocopherol cyclase family protein [Solirubrobacteraceae bacterium]
MIRRLGADPPWGDPRRDHGVAMEGYFWRFSDPAAGRVVFALCGVNRDGDGRRWATVALGEWPSGFVREAQAPLAAADPRRLGAFAGRAFHATPDRLRVDLGEDARLDVRVERPWRWPRHRPLGGSGPAQLIPGLSQYWHPHLLGGHARGRATVGGRRVVLDGARVYGEKNWGTGGFPPFWWWGQANGFAREDVCVAFGGGPLELGPVRREVTAVAVRVGRRVVSFDPVRHAIQARVGYATWDVRARRRGWAVEIDAHADPRGAHVLPVPVPRERRNSPGALEHQGGTLTLRVRRGREPLFEGRSPLAALEHGGAAAEMEAHRRGR